MNAPRSISSRFVAALAAAGLIVPCLLLVYAGSIGPAYWLLQAEWIRVEILILYLPVFLLADQSDFLRTLLEAYVTWWVG